MRFFDRGRTGAPASSQEQRPPGPLKSILVSASVVDQSLRGLRGYAPAEGLCYWFGREISPGLGLAMVTAFPRIYSTERAFQLAEGQMGQLVQWSTRQGLWLLAQLHTHPADEPHSQADEEWAPTRREGFVSIVVPFSAQFSRADQPHWHVFACDRDGAWVPAPDELAILYADVWLPHG